MKIENSISSYCVLYISFASSLSVNIPFRVQFYIFMHMNWMNRLKLLIFFFEWWKCQLNKNVTTTPSFYPHPTPSLQKNIKWHYFETKSICKWLLTLNRKYTMHEHFIGFCLMVGTFQMTKNPVIYKKYCSILLYSTCNTYCGNSSSYIII